MSLDGLKKLDDPNIEKLDDQAAGWLYMMRRPEEEDLKDLLEQSAFAPLIEHAYHRKFARTSKGYYCLAPSGAREGDLVALLEGGDVPFIIREYGEQWLIVGECYVHGIMNGEAYDAARCRGFRFR
ncbi:hypothetical protein CLAFUW4_02323 [Fulvia fulva]|uniref:Uncharacterized protein n=1 Tax=Passalora fulva TaxID=5499 RepID=A0A9Q8L903_PASFU|nr:uncharacterized protein CLAFUR5_02312 [Fulvia fulva]KAK4635343.1 hypothetical protein CLAFUR4_02318 [Fulvia fulva]KAK4637114.1 hypothetical protein CLAFUR0_02322 [Fulvia fulva]UJO13000.1 hypothetical protein CLAFUR5_02312 [Fulvia fulva]WPV10280.1 hypothetical protein CLAFUW4_02323 [Fulvia fulva]WPV24010.1 hypothetical protein CLAFUW7_02323 [Fulvia fulva]